MGYTRKAIATRGRILDSAAALMFAKGFARTKLLEVLNAAKVQKGNFYYYFGSKDELGLTVVNERGAKLIKDWLSSLIDPAADPWDNIHILAAGVIGESSGLDSQSHLVQILTHERTEQGSELRHAIAGVLSEVIDTFTYEFKRLQRAARLVDGVDPAQCGTYVFSLLEGALLLHQSMQDRQLLSDTIELGLSALKCKVSRGNS